MMPAFHRLILAALCAALFSCSPPVAFAETGIASVYGNENGQVRRADGKRYIPSQVLCAHKTRKLGSVVTVTVLKTGRSIRCRVLDRGPFVRGRIIDLSFGAARALGVKGLARVRVE